MAGEDEAESATALLVLERTARFRESLGDALTDGVQDDFVVGCSADLPSSAGKMANGRRVTQRGIRQVQSHLLRQRWNAGASANEAALVHAMRSMDWCVLVDVVPTTKELRVPDRAFRAVLRDSWASQMWRRILVAVATKSSRGRMPGSMFLAARLPTSSKMCTQRCATPLQSVQNLQAWSLMFENLVTKPIQTTVRGDRTSA